MWFPTFQRGYSWDKPHVEAFWKDLLRFLQERDEPRGPNEPKGPKSYFLGPIVVSHKSDETVIELLDGQQRVATATILLSVLRDVARSIPMVEAEEFAATVHTRLILKLDNDGEDIGRYSLQMGETDNLYFQETIQASVPSTAKPKLRSHRFILTARTVLRDSVMAHIATLENKGKLAFLKRLHVGLKRDLVMASIAVESEKQV